MDEVLDQHHPIDADVGTRDQSDGLPELMWQILDVGIQ